MESDVRARLHVCPSQAPWLGMGPVEGAGVLPENMRLGKINSFPFHILSPESTLTLTGQRAVGGHP